jgi:hypothetical protein
MPGREIELDELTGYDTPLDYPRSSSVIRAVIAEYQRARAKHGENTLDGALATDLTRLAALIEETGEVAELLTYDKDERVHGAHGHAAQLRAELIQVASVALTWASILPAE